MKLEDLVVRIRTEVIKKSIERCGSPPGSDLDNVKLSIVEFKDILYDTLKKLEIEELESRW